MLQNRFKLIIALIAVITGIGRLIFRKSKKKDDNEKVVKEKNPNSISPNENIENSQKNK